MTPHSTDIEAVRASNLSSVQLAGMTSHGSLAARRVLAETLRVTDLQAEFYARVILLWAGVKGMARVRGVA